MKSVNPILKREVLATIIAVMEEAERHGLDSMKAAERAFPGVPDFVLYEASASLDCKREHAWWEALERTIDREAIRNAIGSAQRESVPLGSSSDRARSESRIDDIQF